MRTSLRSAGLLCALAVIAGGPLTGLANAAGLPPADADCQQHGTLTKHYTVKQLQTALATMPADIKEYTGCPNVINNQLLSQLGKLPAGGSGGGGGSFIPVWLIVVLALLVLGGAGFGALALRGRGGR
jgi:hypothetical protein